MLKNVGIKINFLRQKLFVLDKEFNKIIINPYFSNIYSQL